MSGAEEVELDAHGAAAALRVEKQGFDEATGALLPTGEKLVLPARTILVAAARSRTPY